MLYNFHIITLSRNFFHFFTGSSFDFCHANLNDENFDKIKQREIPDVVILPLHPLLTTPI